MSDTVIDVENLSKSYLIGHRVAQERYTALRDVVAHQIKSMGASAKRLLRGQTASIRNDVEEFWALRDVSFKVQRGEVLGIVGRNGAGKSTLLKTLSRIVEPTRGRLTLTGRIASLLEVGTGFHPELTGRENVYLNGAILGMTRAEINKKFDEIVAFAEVERFLDTPVKRFSSGMYVRLAFAVAAHLEPEILVVDEVLAVGDAEFRKKCLGKMGDVVRAGRTILFVSHDMSAIRNLCSRGLVLRKGQVVYEADADQAVEWYIRDVESVVSRESLADRSDRSGTGRVRISNFEILDENGSPVLSISSGDTVTFRMHCEASADTNLENIVASIGIGESSGNYLVLLRSNFEAKSLSVKNGSFIDCKVENFPLALGVYSVTLFLSHRESEVLDCVSDAATLTVEGGDFFGTGERGLPNLCRTLVRSDWSSC